MNCLKQELKATRENVVKTHVGFENQHPSEQRRKYPAPQANFRLFKKKNILFLKR